MKIIIILICLNHTINQPLVMSLLALSKHQPFQPLKKKKNHLHTQTFQQGAAAPG